MKTMRKPKRGIIILIALLSCVFAAVIAFLLARFGYYNYDTKVITFQDKKNIGYKVFLKPNDFFDEPYLNENMAYITSLIDDIEIDYNYEISFNDEVGGEYVYYIKGIVEASSPTTNSDYYTEEFILSEMERKTIKDQSQLTLNDSIRVDYGTYNQILLDFRGEYGVSMEGNLKVVLVIRFLVTDQQVGKGNVKDVELELDIPLTSQTVEVPIETTEMEETGEILTYRIEKNGFIYQAARFLSIAFCVISGLLGIYLLYLVFQFAHVDSKYQKKLTKILKVYDGILVNLDKMPKFDNKEVLGVSSFEELLDAHSEIRNPINCITANDGTIFLLVSNDFIYYYKLERETLMNGANRNVEKIVQGK